jgi:hypothetical protein
MVRLTKLLGLGIAAGIALAASPHAFAACPQPVQPATMFSSHVVGCADYYPVASFLAVVGNASTINNNGISAICQDQNGTDGIGLPCSSAAGVLGDGQVYVQFDWGNTTPEGLAPLGCPNAGALPNVGRNFIQIVCNDGTSAIVTTSFDIAMAGYNFDLASRLDPVSGDAFLTFSTQGSPQNLLNVVAVGLVGPPTTICFGQPKPIPVFSDCDPGSVASQFGVTCPDTTPTVGWGAGLFTTTSLLPPTDLRLSAWTLASTTPGPFGSECVSVPALTWIGRTAIVGGQETGAIVSYVRGPTPVAATDVVRIDSAAFMHGKLAVSFSTGNEALIVGFNVYAGSSTKLNAGLIPAKRTGSNAYTFAIGRGAVKSDRTVTVEAVKSDGTTVRTAAAAVM